MVRAEVGVGMNNTTTTSVEGGGAFTTGELRAALQKIVFLRLTADHGDGFAEGTIVAAQYWGAGKVMLTRFPDGATIIPVAHQIHGEWITAQPPTPPKPEPPRAPDSRQQHQPAG
jgi:hypothetical protein